jgi:hypothetical protein
MSTAPVTRPSVVEATTDTDNKQEVPDDDSLAQLSKTAIPDCGQGDYLLCVHPSPWDNYLTKGKSYKVHDVKVLKTGERLAHVVDNNGEYASFYLSRFESEEKPVAEEKTIADVGDKVWAKVPHERDPAPYLTPGKAYTVVGVLPVPQGTGELHYYYTIKDDRNNFVQAYKVERFSLTDNSHLIQTDSTEPHTEHQTGAVRSSDADDVRYDLITPIGLRRVAEAYAEGAKKYSSFNWEKGFPISDILNHAIRHLYLYLEGDRSEDHLGHAAWNCMAACHSEELWPHLNEGTLRGPGCTPPIDNKDKT